MRISIENMMSTQFQISKLSRQMQQIAAKATSPIDGSFSSVNGVGDVGAIHQRVIATDPGSASNSLRSFNEQIQWLAKTLMAEAHGFESQDAVNSRGLDIADAGGSVAGEVMPVMNQPDPGYSPFGFVMPVVNVGPDLLGLAMDLLNTKIWSVSETNSRWKSLADEVTVIVDGLNEAASSLESENDSEATARAAQKIRSVAESGNHFIANAEVMSQKLFGFQANLMASQPKAMSLAMSAMAIPDPAARKAAEQAGLAFMQNALQTQVVAAMPFQHALMTTMPPSGGGDVSSQFGGVNGNGQRFDTNTVVWPRRIAEAIASGKLGPGSFGIVDGQVEGLEGLGMTDSEIQKFNQDLLNGGRASLAQLGAPISAADLVTSGANASPSVGAPIGHTTAGLGGVGSIPQSTGANQHINPATLAANSGAGLTAVNSHAGVPAMIGAPASKSYGFGKHALGLSNTGALNQGNGAGVPGAFSTGSGSGGGTLAGSAGTRGGSLSTGSIGNGSHLGGGTNTTLTAARGGAAARGTMGRGMMPMMAGMGRGGGEDRRIKSVTSKVESDPNRRDLLGEPPAALPGVIGAWAREEG
ncbi:hypothetical protein [Corynebacterium striatum]|uniref:hypothetical protein n=1 Tax=Corynebacterium striatum TaxID=43770 RepID=UPI001FC88705|nr:hypothetical protein [Corynebacterium striatum]GKH16683.1 hypothetical protein CE91St29_09960 [Corynebacterium striatum]